MKYQFPAIFNIRQAREAIQGFPEFVESEKDGYIVFNYLLSKDDTFDCEIRRELRGIKFTKEGGVLSRPFHKFFNVNERDETQFHKIDWNEPHVVLEKLDGSMITPLVFDDGVRWATKMGITDVSLLCEEFVADNKRYDEFARACKGAVTTPIFEYISPRNRIVLPYQKEDLILLAIRDNHNGRYLSSSTVNWIACEYGIPVVKEYSGSIEAIKDQLDIEGVVVRFASGHMVKIKTDWYVAIHRAKDRIRFEKDVIQLILNEQIDDVLSDLPTADRDRIVAYRDQLVKSIDKYEQLILDVLEESNDETRKDFALYWTKKFTPMIGNVCFQFWNDRQNREGIRKGIIQYILNNTATQTKVDSIRKILGVKWETANV